jgi:tungstate transport system substrate-binding protein
MSKKLFPIMALIILMIGLVAGCAPAVTPTTAPAAAPTTAPATAPTDTAAPQPTATAEKPKPTVRAATPDRLILATTTSTQDSGLLEYLLPDFEKQFNTKIDVIAVGTGQALQLGKDGNADVLLVHARAQEDAYMQAGDGTRREDVMYNDFIIVGPESDPANIKGTATGVDAFKKIAEAGAAGKAIFVSRGDKSGTNTKELGIWKSANITPEGKWYVSAGQGMGEVLTMSDEQQAYTLSDRATYLARTKKGLKLQILVEKDKGLLNPYGVIAVNPNKGPQINADLATKFIDWIISVPVQQKIGEFGVADFGQQLFVPSSKPWKDAQGGSSSAPASDAALKVTGLVDKPMAWKEAEVKAMNTIKVESTNKNGDKATYEGVLLSDLLKLAAPKADAKTVVFVANDGFTAEIALADVMACENCIVSFGDQGGFSTVLPGQPGKLQVKGIVEIQVK